MLEGEAEGAAVARGMPRTGRAEAKPRAGRAAALLDGRGGTEPATDEGEDGGEALGRSQPPAQNCLSTQQLLVLTPVSLGTFGVREAESEIQTDFFPLLLRGSCAGSAFLPSTLVAGLST